MSRLPRILASIGVAGATFAVVLLTYEIAAHVLLGPTALDTDAVLNVSRFAAAFLTSLGVGAAVLIPVKRARRWLR